MGLDGQGDFVLYHAVVDNVFRFGFKDYNHLGYWTLQSQENYLEGSLMTPYLGSHDTSRLISRLDSGGNNPDNKWAEQSLPQQPTSSSPYIKSKNAFSWLLTIPGLPVIYMGDEYGEYGGSDPDNRHSFRMYNELNSNEQELLHSIQELGMVRKNSNDLKNGSYRPVYSDGDLLVFARETSSSETLVMINSGDNTREVTLNKGIDIFYNSYLDVRNNLTFSSLDDSLTFSVDSNDFSVFTYNRQTVNVNESTDNDDNLTDISFNDENNISVPLVNETNDNVDNNEVEDSTPDLSLDGDSDTNQDESEESGTQEENIDTLTNDDGQESESFLLLRGLLFITFLSLLITFIYTRGR
ncbi:MAG: hypothetical protein CM15mP42_12350 [Methanobacteriota archaeon]|nr:MAG: hypothetical protein CM15mP42_12350 [Euryarchaeota archaeon]